MKRLEKLLAEVSIDENSDEDITDEQHTSSSVHEFSSASQGELDLD